MEKRSIPVWFILISLGSIVGCGAQQGSQYGGYESFSSRRRNGSLTTRRGFGCDQNGIGGSLSRGEVEGAPTKIVAVFFENDGSTPMTLPPTEVVFELESFRSKTAELKTVTLEADPTSPNRFVSAASSFPGGVAGKIRVKIDGQDLEESFSAR